MEINLILDQLDRLIEYARFYQRKGFNWSCEDEVILKRLKDKRIEIMEA